MSTAQVQRCFGLYNLKRDEEWEAWDDFADAVSDMLKDHEDLLSTLQQRDERIVELEEEVASLRGLREGGVYWGQP